MGTLSCALRFGFPAGEEQARLPSGQQLWYPCEVPMLTLFAISTFALCALLWASISIGRYVRRARRRDIAADELVAQARTLPRDTDQGKRFEESHKISDAPPPLEMRAGLPDQTYPSKGFGDLNDPCQAYRTEFRSRAS